MTPFANVRLQGIKVPEPASSGWPGACGADEAYDHLAVLLPRSTTVTVTTDAAHTDWQDVTGKVSTDMIDDVGLKMIEDGYATAVPDESGPRYAAAEKVAKTEGRGMWTTCPGK